MATSATPTKASSTGRWACLVGKCIAGTCWLVDLDTDVLGAFADGRLIKEPYRGIGSDFGPSR